MLSCVPPLRGSNVGYECLDALGQYLMLSLVACQSQEEVLALYLAHHLGTVRSILTHERSSPGTFFENCVRFLFGRHFTRIVSRCDEDRGCSAVFSERVECVTIVLLEHSIT